METDCNEPHANKTSMFGKNVFLSEQDTQFNGPCKQLQSENGELRSNFQCASTINTGNSTPFLIGNVVCLETPDEITINGNNGNNYCVDGFSSMPHSINLQNDVHDSNADESALNFIPKEESENCALLVTKEKNHAHFCPDDPSSVPVLSVDKNSAEEDSISNLSSVGEIEDQDKVSLLLVKVEDLTGKLMRSQVQMEALLEEKQRWLATRQQQSKPSVKQKTGITSDTAAMVVKFAQSEQQRMKAEAKVNELEAQILRLTRAAINDSDSAAPLEKSEPVEELHKALTEAREQAEQLRRALRLEETHVSDLGAKLTAAREVHCNEQKRVARQTELISKLNHDVESLKRQLNEANKVREREAKRLCDEVTAREITGKYRKALVEMAALKERITQLEEEQKSKLELNRKFTELQKAHDSLLSMREEMESCIEREAHLSEFTQRLTERNADLQTAYLATKERLEVSERDLSDASRAAQEATNLIHALEQRALVTSSNSAKAIDRLEAKVSELQQSEEELKEELIREQVKNTALKRKQHALDRELARLTAQQRKSLQQISATEAARLDTISKMTPNNSNPSLFALTDSTSTISGVSKPSSPPPVIGNVLLTAPRNGDVPGQSEATDYRIDESIPGAQTLEPNHGLLLNKIDRLHRTNARLMDKIEFMHEHINQLTQELQKKSQILEHYLARITENEGTAVSSMVDSNKQQLTHRGGTLMAAVFAGKNDTTPPDLRTSLQLNQKLQQLLEDTLYKNLILKENVETFADEIGRLKRANKELKNFVSTQSYCSTDGAHR